jgi:hypothetical protein
MFPIFKISKAAQFRDRQLYSVGVRSVSRIDLPMALHLPFLDKPLVRDYRRYSRRKPKKTLVVPFRREFRSSGTAPPGDFAGNSTTKSPYKTDSTEKLSSMNRSNVSSTRTPREFYGS